MSEDKVLVRMYGDSGGHTAYTEQGRNEPLRNGDMEYREIPRELWERYRAAKDICDEIEGLIDSAPAIHPQKVR